jgi:hypothetical protein
MPISDTPATSPNALIRAPPWIRNGLALEIEKLISFSFVM